MLYDVFISHATEDKKDFVRPLAQLLKAQRLTVWYDEMSLKPGDSLRRSIDNGLAKSRYGVVVLSPSFFRKNWTQWELDGLVHRQVSGGQQVMIPVWHQVTAQDVMEYSPSLADKVAINSSIGVEEVARKLVELLRPEGSTLLSARDIVIAHGYEPPVVTDDWWLDAVEASAGNAVEGTFQEAMGWGRWGFPLPERSTSPAERGERLAWAAMQMMWQQKAFDMRISQISRPEVVHAFIRAQPGLAETCHDYLSYLIAYAPQLSIPGFGDEFEPAIEEMYQASLSRRYADEQKRSTFGTALTVDGSVPRCEEQFALRHPDFGGYEAGLVACGFVQGYSVMGGPPVQFYAHIDYLAWVLSSESDWLPVRIKQYLLEGMKLWAVWHTGWAEGLKDLGFGDRRVSSMFTALLKVERLEDFKLTRSAQDEIEQRFAISRELLGLPQSASTLTKRFVEFGFIEAWVADHIERSARK